ncbi:uncharacterized protein LOC136764945 [Amia ocellicauda]|uniref:uncharacterized protein LOC136764945 n=1 Tax=Amia ocellicauda TaxID=2972642 RepID=UPI0034644134
MSEFTIDIQLTELGFPELLQSTTEGSKVEGQPPTQEAPVDSANGSDGPGVSMTTAAARPIPEGVQGGRGMAREAGGKNRGSGIGGAGGTGPEDGGEKGVGSGGQGGGPGREGDGGGGGEAKRFIRVRRAGVLDPPRKRWASSPEPTDDSQETGSEEEEEEDETEEDQSRAAPSPSFMCEVCGRSLSSSFALQEHQRLHTGERPYRCQECSKMFCHLANYRAHLQRHRVPPGRRHRCKVCGAMFEAESELQEHLDRHPEREFYQCDHCKKVFTSLPACQTHLEGHRRAWRHTCPDCGRGFRRRSSLRSHQVSQHSHIADNACHTIPSHVTAAPARDGAAADAVTSTAAMAPPSTSAPAPAPADPAPSFPCPDCSRVYSKERLLFRHSFSHRGVEPYTCVRCGCHFRLPSLYRRHSCRPQSLQCVACLGVFPSQHDFQAHKEETGCWGYRGAGGGGQEGVGRRSGGRGRGGGPGGGEIRCMECGLAFTSRQELQTHAGAHQRVNVCSECGRGFRSALLLVSHMRAHGGDRPCLCQQCGRGFTHAQDLAHHRDTCHLREPPQEVPRKPKKAPKPPPGPPTLLPRPMAFVGGPLLMPATGMGGAYVVIGQIQSSPSPSPSEVVLQYMSQGGQAGVGGSLPKLGGAERGAVNRAGGVGTVEVAVQQSDTAKDARNVLGNVSDDGSDTTGTMMKGEGGGLAGGGGVEGDLAVVGRVEGMLVETEHTGKIAGGSAILSARVMEGGGEEGGMGTEVEIVQDGEVEGMPSRPGDSGNIVGGSTFLFRTVAEEGRLGGGGERGGEGGECWIQVEEVKSSRREGEVGGVLKVEGVRDGGGGERLGCAWEITVESMPLNLKREREEVEVGGRRVDGGDSSGDLGPALGPQAEVTLKAEPRSKTHAVVKVEPIPVDLSHAQNGLSIKMELLDSDRGGWGGWEGGTETPGRTEEKLKTERGGGGVGEREGGGGEGSFSCAWGARVKSEWGTERGGGFDSVEVELSDEGEMEEEEEEKEGQPHECVTCGRIVLDGDLLTHYMTHALESDSTLAPPPSPPSGPTPRSPPPRRMTLRQRKT